MKKAIKDAPKYVLHLFGAGYLADKQNLTGIVFTKDINKAQKFAVGFDDAEQKTGIWNAEAKRMFRADSVKFEVKYL